MPFKSKAQRRFMYANHPEIAAEFSKATPKGKNLPEHVRGAVHNAERAQRKIDKDHKRGDNDD
jgi:hypothetical protein